MSYDIAQTVQYVHLHKLEVTKILWRVTNFPVDLLKRLVDEWVKSMFYLNLKVYPPNWQDDGFGSPMINRTGFSRFLHGHANVDRGLVYENPDDNTTVATLLPSFQRGSQRPVKTDWPRRPTRSNTFLK